MKKSNVYKLNGELFRYNYKYSEVEYLMKADKEMLKDNEEWLEKHNRPLWDIDEKGYSIIDTVGLNVENWKNKEVRDEYLEGWLFELSECVYW